MKKRKIAPTAPLPITPTVSPSSGPIESLQIAPTESLQAAPSVALDDKVIAHRAYAIWQAEGEPVGRDFDHWLKAESELRANSAAPASATEAGLVPKG